jgi:hypothetical protein
MSFYCMDKFLRVAPIFKPYQRFGRMSILIFFIIKIMKIASEKPKV